MRRVIFLLYFFFSSTSLLFSNSFGNLHEDLVNFWRIGRSSVYLNNLSGRVMPFFTGNNLDFFIDANAFFVVKDDISGRQFLTRNGQFTFDVMGFLRNLSGYFVLNTRNEYINAVDIDFDLRSFFDLFLIATLNDISNITITGNYVSTQYYTTITGMRVVNRMLDSRAFSLRMLLEKAMTEVIYNRNFSNNEELIALFYRRFYEKIEMNLLTEDETVELLNKIESFTNKILNYCSSDSKKD